MTIDQPPESSDAASAGSTGRRRWLRHVVPIPQGNGFGGKTAWVARRIALWYLLILVMLAFFQRSLIYQPTRTASIDAAFSGLDPRRVEPVTVSTEDGLSLRGWFVRALSKTALPTAMVAGNGAPATAASNGHPLVIYFPGNAGNRGHRAIELDVLSRLGANACLVDYRGYGDNPGKPTEEGLASDARRVWEEMTVRRGFQPSQIVLLGESLGGGVASRLASELCIKGTPPGGLILRSTFPGLADVAAYHFPWLPVRWLLIDRFPSTERVVKVTCPILVIHGTADTIIPLSYGKQLFDAVPPVSSRGVAKTLVELRGAGHNDILYSARDEYLRVVAQFLAHIESPARAVK